MLRGIAVGWTRLVLRFYEDFPFIVRHQRGERMLPGYAGLAGKRDAAAQMTQIGFGWRGGTDFHRGEQFSMCEG